MRYRRLGQWGVQVSEVSLGSWLTYGGSVEAEAAEQCIHRAYDLGINLFDTANAYARGAAEEVVGRALARYRRESYVLATKVFFPMSRRPNDSGLSRKHVTEQCHQSLRRLGVDHVDLYQCHRYDEHTPLEETCRAMDDLVRQGEVLYWGVSEWSATQIAEAVRLCRAEGWAVPVSNQPQYSLLWRVIEREVLDVCADVGMGNVVWSPLAQGVLTGKYHSADELPPGTRATTVDAGIMARFLRQDVLDAVGGLRPIAEEADCTLSQLALAWCLRQPMVSSVIVGASRPGQVADNAAVSELDLDPELVARAGELLAPVSEV